MPLERASRKAKAATPTAMPNAPRTKLPRARATFWPASRARRPSLTASPPRLALAQAPLLEAQHATGPPRGALAVRDDQEVMPSSWFRLTKRSVICCAAGGIEAAGGLVGEDDLGPLEERARDGDALLLAAREARGEVAGATPEPDPLEHLVGAMERSLARHGAVGEEPRQRHVLPAAQVVEEVEGLEDEADAAAAQARQRRVALAREVAAEQLDAAAVAPIEAAPMLSSEVLPHPLGPTMERYAPGSTSRSTPRSTGTSS